MPWTLLAIVVCGPHSSVRSRMGALALRLPQPPRAVHDFGDAPMTGAGSPCACRSKNAPSRPGPVRMKQIIPADLTARRCPSGLRFAVLPREPPAGRTLPQPWAGDPDPWPHSRLKPLSVPRVCASGPHWSKNLSSICPWRGLTPEPRGR